MDIYGSELSDWLVGTSQSDAIYGEDSCDTIEGGLGNDLIDGGDGDDTASYANSTKGVKVDLSIAIGQVTNVGTDTLVNIENLLGSTFNDTLSGNSSNNTIDGGAGIDTLSYKTATNGVVVSLSTEEVQNTGLGNDIIKNMENILGSDYDDVLGGNSGDNTIDGGLGVDTVSYASSAKAVSIDLSKTVVQATGDGNDIIKNIENVLGSSYDDVLAGNKYNNTIDGGAGSDTVSYANSTKAVTVNLSTVGAQDTIGAGIDTIVNTENILGSKYNDTLTGDNNSNTIEGGLGNDLIDGGDGDDTASYANSTKGVKVDLSIAIGQVTNVGTDTLVNIENLLGSTFNDTLSGNSSNNTIDGGAGIDTLSYKTATNGVVVSLSTEEVQNTGLGNDIIKNMENILGSDYDDVLGGNSGDNTIDGGLGVDTVSYASSAKAVSIDLSKTVVQATGDGNDIIKNIENVLGSSYDDVLAGNKYNNTIDGGAGSDTVSYANSTKAVTVNLSTVGAQDTIGAGIDTIVNTENILGSKYNDTLTGDNNSNTIEGGLGNDLIDGGDGDDTASYANSTKGVKVDLSIAIGQVTNVGTDTLVNIENLLGSTFNDTLSGNSSNNTIDGGAGIDTLSYKTATNGVVVSLSTEEVQNTGLGNDIIKNMENILGSDYDDVLGGNSGDNTIDGGLGVDTVSYASSAKAVSIDLSKTVVQATGDGNDIIKNIENVLGSSYDDVLAGNKYNNTIDGGAGSDTVSYANSTKAVTVNLSTVGAQDTIGAGIDTIVNTENILGSKYNDTLTGDNNSNTIEGGLGNDLIDGGDGDDTASYANSTKGVKVDLSIAIGQVTNVGTDTLVNIENLLGSTFNDTLSGNSSNNTIDGGAGIDTLSYKTATNGVVVSLSTEEVQNTGLGNDIIKNMENILGSDYDDVLGGNSGDNTIDGGLGVDTVSYASSAKAVSIDLSKTVVQATGDGNDIIKNIENVLGSSYDDVLAGNKYNNTIDGGAGDDYISADLGDDIIYGGSGYDYMDGGLGDDLIDGGAGSDTVSYATSTKAVTVNLSTVGAQDTIGAGIDTIVNTENILGSKYNDTLTGDNNSNTIEGELGNDLIDGGDGDDFISGGKGADILSGGAGYDLLGYQEDTEGLYVNILTNEARGGTAQGDIISGFEGIIGGSGNDVLIGNNGDNELFGNEGDDVIFGGLGNDIIIEESGYNTLYGEDGDDFIYGGVNDDFIIGGDDNDTIYGKYGNDRISGGEGNDIFVFDTELNEDGNVDKISDFIHSDDVFYIDNDIFESFSSVIFGSIESENFVSGKSAIDENDYIIYDTDTGNIWYDADGSGAESSAVLFATLCNKPADVDYTNFIVI